MKSQQNRIELVFGPGWVEASFHLRLGPSTLSPAPVVRKGVGGTHATRGLWDPKGAKDRFTVNPARTRKFKCSQRSPFFRGLEPIYGFGTDIRVKVKAGYVLNAFPGIRKSAEFSRFFSDLEFFLSFTEFLMFLLLCFSECFIQFLEKSTSFPGPF